MILHKVIIAADKYVLLIFNVFMVDVEKVSAKSLKLNRSTNIFCNFHANDKKQNLSISKLTLLYLGV